MITAQTFWAKRSHIWHRLILADITMSGIKTGGRTSKSEWGSSQTHEKNVFLKLDKIRKSNHLRALGAWEPKKTCWTLCKKGRRWQRSHLGQLPSLFTLSSTLKVLPGRPGQEHWQLRLMGTQALCSRGQSPYQPVALLLCKGGSVLLWLGKQITA